MSIMSTIAVILVIGFILLMAYERIPEVKKYVDLLVNKLKGGNKKEDGKKR